MANHVDGLDVDAWGDVPPLAGHTLFAEAATEKQRADLANMTLATLCDMVLGEDAADRSDDALVRAVGELERERDAARQELENAKEVGRMWYEDICEIKRALAEFGYPTLNIEDAAESVRRLGQERHTAIDNMHENADIADEFICLFKKANEAKREWRNESKDESQWAKHYHDDWIKERDAALTEAELHRVAMRRIVFAVFGRDLAEDEHTDVDSICEWIHGLRAENQNMLKRAEQAEADARALANIARRLRHDRRNAQEAELIAKYLDGVK